MLSDRFACSLIGSTAGSWTRHVLGGLNVKWYGESAHCPLSHYKAQYGDLPPAIGHIRNPFDWYLSKYLLCLRFHFWRSGFRDWFYNCVPPGEGRKGICMWRKFSFMGAVEPGGGIAYDYIIRFENLLDDVIYVLGQVVPDLITEEEIRAEFPAVAMGWRWTYQEGIEQWLRDELYIPEIVEQIYEQDAPIFERFGYTFEQRYYHTQPPGGSSYHEGINVGNWEQEKQLSQHWTKMEGRPGPW